jgi:hypothetical protein
MRVLFGFPDSLAAFLFGGSPRIKKRQDSAPSGFWIEIHPPYIASEAEWFQYGSVNSKLAVKTAAIQPKSAYAD